MLGENKGVKFGEIEGDGLSDAEAAFTKTVQSTEALIRYMSIKYSNKVFVCKLRNNRVLLTLCYYFSLLSCPVIDRLRISF